MEKILVVVSGGNIQDIISTTSNIQVFVVDYDNFSDNNSKEEMSAQLMSGFDYPYSIQTPNVFNNTMSEIDQEISETIAKISE